VTVLSPRLAAAAGRCHTCVCDDDPAPPEAVVAHAATLLGVPPPPSVVPSPPGSPMARLLRRQQAGLEPPDQDRAPGEPALPAFPRRARRNSGGRGLPKNPASGIVRLEETRPRRKG
jgi:hypothetical protein